jgi:nucleoside-diphosphate-sugar epimerase
VPIQPGGVRAACIDTDPLKSLTGYEPSTKLLDGVRQFVNGYHDR